MYVSPGPARRSTSKHAFVLLLAVAALAVPVDAGSLLSVNPLAASPGVAIQISGSNFNPTAANNLIAFVPAGGQPVTTAATAVATVDAAQGIRRLNLTVPDVPTGAAALRVTNTATGQVSDGLSFEVVRISLPGATSASPGASGVAVDIEGTAAADFTTLTPSRVIFGAGITVRSVTVASPRRATAIIDVASNAVLGPRSLAVRPLNQSLLATNAFVVVTAPPPNRAPRITSKPVLAGAVGQQYTYQVTAVDDDNDALSYSLEQAPAGAAIDPASGLVSWTPQGSQSGAQTIVVRVLDGHPGGAATQPFTVEVQAPPTMTRLEVQPPALRFTQAGAKAPLTVTGHRSNGSVVDLTPAATGTTYQSSNPFVATVDAAGQATAVANGTTTITATNGALTGSSAVEVEIGVSLQSLELTPASSVLRDAGAIAALALTGHYSDGSTRDLTSAAGTTYSSSDDGIGLVSAVGRVTAVTNGTVTIKAFHGGRQATAAVQILLAGSTGFLRGAVFDDSRGLPLANAVVALVTDGGGAASSINAISDDRGRFVLPGRGGDAVVRVTKQGFTTVERRGTITADGTARLLDARLTPLDSRETFIRSVFGGRGQDQSGGTTIDIAAGAASADAVVHVTRIEAQGLAARLPQGWSPVGAVDLAPAGLTFAQPAVVTLINRASLPGGTPLVLAGYDPDRHEWIARGSGRVSADARTMSANLSGSGQFALLLGDGSPFVPPDPLDGQPLQGVAAVTVGPQVAATGEVVPRTAPPGEAARAVGRVALQSAEALPSGTAIQVHVTEQFDLADATTEVPLPFTEDILLHARPRLAGAAAGQLSAAFVITPSRTHTIQELLQGVVKLDVARPEDRAASAIVGATGGSVGTAETGILIVPAGALAASTVVRVERVQDVSIAAQVSGLDVLAGFEVDLVGTTFSAGASLTLPRPPGVLDTDQVLLAAVFVDARGVRRLRLAGAGRIDASTLSSVNAVGSLQLGGITTAGQYLFVRTAQPVGFISGTVTAAGGSPAPLTLVVSDTAPFADVTAAQGRFVIAGRAGADAHVNATHLLTRDEIAGTAHGLQRDTVVPLALALAVVPPSVVAVTPSNGASKVPLDASLAVDFSEAIDPSSITEQTVSLRTGGATVAIVRTLSQDRRRLTIRPVSPLAGNAAFALSLTSGIRDLSGAPLTPFAGASFTTLDPTKPPQPAPGRILAGLPDVDGLVLVFGTAGAVEPGSAVTATNIRTQETLTVLALADGSFRLRVLASIGDRVVLTLRDASGRESTLSIDQFTGDDGVTAIGPAGGTFQSAGRVGTILPRALTAAGTFVLHGGDDSVRPTLPGGFAYVDGFSLTVADGAEFNRVASLTLTETQNRMPAAVVQTAPFNASGQITVPADALVNSSIRFSATVQDAGGSRRTASVSSRIVASGPAAAIADSSQTAEFPTLLMDTAAEAVPGEVIGAHAFAPAARIDLAIAAPAASGGQFFLAHPRLLGGVPRLQVIDSLERRVIDSGDQLRTSGRLLPGMSASGEYVVVRSAETLVLITGRMSGPSGVVTADGSPFVFVTDAPNGTFVLPVPASRPFALRFEGFDGVVRGSATGDAPPEGLLNIGDPLGAVAAQLQVKVEPDTQTVADISNPLVLRFSEAVDLRTLSGSGLVITDVNGVRVFGSIGTADGGRTVIFTPSRRWRLSASYRYGISTSVLGLSGARLPRTITGQFSTFAPRLLTALPEGAVADVAVSGASGMLGTATGAAILSLSSPGAPGVLARLTLGGGAQAVAFVQLASLVDRAGQTQTGPFALVATGVAASAGRVHLVSLADPSAPRDLGSMTLPIDGLPREIVASGDRAWVAIENGGIVSIRLTQMTPAGGDAAAVVVARHPAAGTEDVRSIALLGDRVIAATAAGLLVLDATTLQPRGTAAVSGGLLRVASREAFACDVNGDGTVSPDELFGLAVGVGGANGTAQLFKVPASGDPVLLSVIRFTGETSSVAIDGIERLAYVGLGARGLGIVDLDGPASVQPIDTDHDGTDDRVLGLVNKLGANARVALGHGGSVAHVADGPTGLSVVQVLPPRTTFQNVSRDPVRGSIGDETSILQTRQALLTDEAIRVDIDAAVPAGAALTLLVDETTGPGAPAALSFEDGGLSAPLTAGANAFTLPIHTNRGTGSHVTLRVRASDGSQIAAFAFDLVPPPTTADAPLRRLIIAPDDMTVGDGAAAQQLSVLGVFDDGLTLNVSAAASGTTYVVENPLIAAISPDGLLLPLAGGRTSIFARNGSRVASASVRVIRAAAIQELVVRATNMTLTAIGQSSATEAFVQMTDGAAIRNLRAAGTTFESSDLSVATVDADGRITAVGAGVATVTLRNRNVTATVHVAVEPRTAPNLTAIDLKPFARPASTDAGVDARADVAGSGSLEGLTVSFTAGGRTVTAVTDYSGIAVARVAVTAPGALAVRATVVNPATGSPLEDNENLVVQNGGADAEPNDSLAAAIPIQHGRPVTGTLGPGDLTDSFRSTTRMAGIVSARITLSAATNPADVQLRIFSADGTELQRQQIRSRSTSLRQAVIAGDNFVTVTTAGAPVTYTLELRFEQGALAITSVAPLSGGPGTAVAIDGSGFSTDPEDVRVLFGGIAGRVTAATPTHIDALVPALGIDGPMTVIVLDRRAAGPRFTTGNAGPRPPITLAEANPVVRFDPVSRQTVDVSRLTVTLDPVAGPAVAASLAAVLNGAVVGQNPVLSTYVLEFRNNATLAGLESLSRQLRADPNVVRVSRVLQLDLRANVIDARDNGFRLTGTTIPAAIAFLQARIFDAIEAIRQTPPFIEFGAVFRPVHIAVADSGFSPFSGVDFTSAGQNVVQLHKPNASGIFEAVPPAIGNDLHGHGTKVTSIIASLNDGSSVLSGGYGGLFKPGEATFSVDVYSVMNAAGIVWDTALDAALAELADGGITDVLNLSLGADFPGPGFQLDADRRHYRDLFALFGGRTLIVIAAGNAGVQAEFSTPSSLEMTLPFVMSIGATAVANRDGSGEGTDHRAVFNGSPLGPSTQCDPLDTSGGSNCGVGVTMAAPGEDVLVASTKSPGFTTGAGTSFAAPMVTAVAALLKAIGPAAGLTPDLLRTLLVDSGDDITTVWGTGQTIRRLNALNAVRLLLPASAPQMIYVADQAAQNGAGSLPGRIVGIDIDPLTGRRPTPANPDVVIGLSVARTTPGGGTVLVQTSEPTSLAIEPGGDKLYAVVKGPAAAGDGLLVVSTRSNRAIDFLPFSGADAFGPAAANGTSPVFTASLRPPMAFSKDGRLLYVATSDGLVVVNAIADKVVRSAADLPAEYGTFAATLSAQQFAQRLGAIRAAIHTGAAGRPGVSISGLAISPDGTTLYGAVQTGGGGGQQPGGVIAIDVNLYKDGSADGGLQSDLTTYLKALTPATVPMADAGGFLGGDEPGAVGVSRDGKHVYVINGGLNFFEAVPPHDLDLAKYSILLAGPAASALGLSGGIAGVTLATAAFMNTASRLHSEMLIDIKAQAESGITFVSAPGVTGAFDAADPASINQNWLFTSDVGFGWSPSTANGGAIINQLRFKEVFAKRPFDIAMRPDGRRAIVPFFQTGNFGVLDLAAQSGFQNPPAGQAKPAFAALPPEEFQGFVGVTPALKFDNHVWPSRGAFRSQGTPVPSPDENRLFAWHAEYAQNGRFAVASHAGSGSPRSVTATIPDFAHDVEQAFALGELGGGVVSSTAVRIIEDDQVLTVSPGDSVTLKRGGGAISIIDDQAITDDLSANAAQSFTSSSNGTVRPFFATAPLCAEHSAIPERCTAEPTTTITTYTPASGTKTTFHRPRGVTIQPFISFASPRFGDRVGLDTALQIVWRDARVQQVFIALRDPATLNQSGNPTLLKEIGGQLIPQQIDAMTTSVRFGDLFPPNLQPVLGKHYVVQVGNFVTVPGLEELSRTSIDVVFDNLDGPPASGEEIKLRPFLVPFLTAPSNTPKQLKVSFIDASGQITDISADPHTTYLWLGDPSQQLIMSSNPLVNTAMRLGTIAVGPIIDKIKAALSSAGSPIDFKLADITVNSSGQITINGAGLQVVQAVYNNDGNLLFSAPCLVLGGLELSGIDLEPDSLLTDVLSVSGAESLGKKLADKLGTKVNTPLILTATSPGTAFSFLSNEGAVELNEIEFTYLGTGKITASQVIGAIEPLVRARVTQMLGGPLSPTGRIAGKFAAKVLVALINEVVDDAVLRLVDLKSSDTGVATVENESLLFKGDVTAVAPGIGAIKGELDLGGFGKAKDVVPVWVLPNLTQAILEPANTLICRADSTRPGPKVHTLAVLKLASSISLTPGQLGLSDTVDELAKLVVPTFLPTGTFHDVTFTIGDFKFGFRGTITVDGSKITWVEPEFQFYVPNAPGVTNRYEFFPPGNPQLPGIVHTGDIEPFATHIVHEQVAGRNQINNFVSIPGLGSVQGIGSVTVTDFCSTPFVIKELTSSFATVEPGTELHYTITVGNPRSVAIDDVKIEETALYQASVQTGDPARDAIEVKQIIPVGTIPARSSIEVPVTIPAFGQEVGHILNRAKATGTINIPPVTRCQVDPTAPGCATQEPPCVVNPFGPGCPPQPVHNYCEDNPNDPKCVCSRTPTPPECIVPPPPVIVTPPLAAPFITEMVLDPKRDWNDTTGGNGVPFDFQPGTAAPDGDDVWIEVTSLTAAANWRIRLTDTTGATFSKVVGNPPLFSNVKVVSGFGVGSARIVKVEVIDQNGTIRQSVDVAAIESALGPATGPSDEALTWSVFGAPNPVLQQFRRRPATIGVFNPF